MRRDGRGWAGLRRATACLVAALSAAGAVGAAKAATFQIDISRFDADEEAPTFSGGGTLTVDGPLREPSDIGALSLGLTTLGSLGDDDAVFRLDYTAADVTSVLGFSSGAVPPDLRGIVLGFGPKSSLGGEVTLIDLSLDFERGAQGFCFSSDDEGLAQCVRGGGTSTGVEAELSAAIIPLPATLPLAATALGALGWGLRRRRSARAA